MATKRYYWLKLEEHFFKSNSIKIIKRMEGGYKFIVLYLQMMLLAINDNGKLFVGEGMPFDAQMLSLVVDMEEEDVISALRLFEKLKMIETKDGVIKILNFEDMVGSETEEARRKRAYRQKISDNVPTISTDIEIDKNIDKEKYIYTEREEEEVGNGTQGGTPTQNNKNDLGNISRIPSLEEVKAYSDSRQSGVDVEKFYDHYSAVGWMMGNTPIKDWRAAFRKWEKTEKPAASPVSTQPPYASYTPYNYGKSSNSGAASFYGSSGSYSYGSSSKEENSSSFDIDDMFYAAVERVKRNTNIDDI